jgi:hypothetical protein
MSELLTIMRQHHTTMLCIVASCVHEHSSAAPAQQTETTMTLSQRLPSAITIPLTFTAEKMFKLDVHPASNIPIPYSSDGDLLRFAAEVHTSIAAPYIDVRGDIQGSWEEHPVRASDTILIASLYLSLEYSITQNLSKVVNNAGH